MIALSIEELSFAPTGADEVLHNISLRAEPGEILGILGPNGAGKSSLLRLFYGASQPTRGVVKIGGTDINQLSTSNRARLVAAVPQESPPDFHLTVRDIVETGRTAYISSLLGRDPGGSDAVDNALKRLGLEAFSHRNYSTLSGGEKRRTLIARALAQDTQALILDEPVNHLDIRHKLEVLTLIRHLRSTVMISLHDFDLAAHFCNRLAILHHGYLVAEGTPEDVLVPEIIRDVFGVEASIVRDKCHGTLRVITESLPIIPEARKV